jgi:hypothetical protein
MEMVRRGSAASGPVIKYRPAAAKISHEMQKNFNMLRDGLRLMGEVGDGEMSGKNRHGVAENQEFLLVEDPFLIFRQTVETEKTRPLFDAFLLNVCQGAPDSAGVMLNVDGKSVASYFPGQDVFQGPVSLLQSKPRFFLL